jgi:hypothetical protein
VRIVSIMRWGIVLALLLSVGCGAPATEEEHPFLRLRQDHVQTQEESPDAGEGLQPVPEGDPGQPQ